jgi:hypothetical protein
LKKHRTNRRDAIYPVLAGSWLIACAATGELNGGNGDGRGNGAPSAAPSASASAAPTGGASAGNVEGVFSDRSEGRDRTGGIDRSRGIDGPSSGDIVGVASDDGPFKSLEAAANSPAVFSAPRAGVPLEGNGIAFVALATGAANAAQPAIFAQRSTRGAPTVLYSGAALVSPLDIDVSVDGRTLFVADFAGGASGTGAILSLPSAGGTPTTAAEGWSPRSVTVGPNDEVYFSGRDPSTGQTGVFELSGGTVSTVFSGGPLIEPSGIAAFKDGRLLVADARALDNRDTGSGSRVASEASIVLIENGKASVFATGFAAGFPAGLALTLDEATLVVSGEGRDRSDTVWLIDVAHPEQKPKSVTDTFSRYQDAAAGIKRAHRSNTFIFASTAADGGTVFKIEG